MKSYKDLTIDDVQFYHIVVNDKPEGRYYVEYVDDKGEEWWWQHDMDDVYEEHTLKDYLDYANFILAEVGKDCHEKK
jgi:hypothetical protein